MPKITGKFIIIAGKNLWMIFPVILDTFGVFFHDFSYFWILHAPLSRILEDLILTYREKETAIICFDGTIAF